MKSEESLTFEKIMNSITFPKLEPSEVIFVGPRPYSPDSLLGLIESAYKMKVRRSKVNSYQLAKRDAVGPCPCCGAKGEVIHDVEYGPNGGFHVGCTVCPVMTDTVVDRGDAIAAWNRRPEPRTIKKKVRVS